jgi:heterodisulfide reductase subunit A-like polyferredoxin
MRAMTKSASALRPHPVHPQDAHPRDTLLPLPAHVPIAIIGSGFSGLGSAIALANEGYAPGDMVLLERRSGLGGTW